MTQNKKRILVVDSNLSNGEEIKRLLEDIKHNIIVYEVGSSIHAIDSIYGDPPNLIIINSSLEGEGGMELCGRIKSDIVFGHLPIILLVDTVEQCNNIDWEMAPADEYIVKPFNPTEVINRVYLTFARTERVWDANPLTRLPGNHSIMKEMQRRLDNNLYFVVAYVDLDFFKAYNDKYGFLRGDEIIKMTARILTNKIREIDSPETFAGHIGGDDFVLIVPSDKADVMCESIIKNFDLIIGNFYDEEDRIRGHIDSTNRKGEKERFPIMSISIGAVTNEHRDIKHIGEISALAAEMKKYSKTIKGSNYSKDVRRTEI